MRSDPSPNLQNIPDLSVVIVNWNVSDLLRACLASLIQKSDATIKLEVIVVDNASSDGSVEMVRSEFPQVTLIVNHNNRGFTGGNNQGLAAARGRYVMLLNPDTEILGDALPTLVNYLDAHTDVGLLGPQLIFPSRQVQSSRRRFPTLGTLFTESTWLESVAPSALLDRFYVRDKPDDSVLDVDWVTGAAMLVRHKVVQQVGGLDEDFFMYSEELDWCRRIKAAGWRIVYHPAARIIHHVGRSSEQAVPARHINFQRSKVRYTQKYHGSLSAATLRLYLLAQYTWQLALELCKGIVGHKRSLRWQRVAAYWEVLKSGL